ncbi:aminotransferase-like domain-containing protein [Vibrio salinus]|uniref:aminotransferase-like domain-containing protein n=1 Tax=Vibrio salinus TaxID=2899784 RepID=UPI001E58E808|nr:PLP-dependent aminotransferase family protein [Vibrio salinus]MCE0494901.1 PLP-dependent aminotransferase family protein [Vibrio salinus]
MTIIKIDISKQSGTAIYKQIAGQISELINKGILEPNHKLPTHRALAEQLGVTVGTVTRAYAEAERLGAVEARVGAGTYVVDKQKGYWEFDGLGDGKSDKWNFAYNVPPSVGQNSAIRRAMVALSESDSSLMPLLAYQPSVGCESHRAIVASWLQEKGRAIKKERFLFTSGVQHGIQMILDTFTRSGDTILTETLTYPGLFSMARHKQITIKGVAFDSDGMLPSALENACVQYQPRFVYLNPTLQNPTTLTMPTERREEIIEICDRHNVYIIEDDVNGFLPENSPVPFVNLSPERVIHIGSFSKCLAPGLRVGYIQPPKALFQQLSVVLKNHSWMTSPLLTGLICELIYSGKLDVVLRDIRSESAQRMQSALEYIGDVSPDTHGDGFHIWLPLPENWRLSDFMKSAQEENILIKSAEQFTPPAGHILPAIRVSLSSAVNQSQMMKGLQALKRLLVSSPVYDFDL